MKPFSGIIFFCMAMAGCSNTSHLGSQPVKKLTVTYYLRLPGTIAVDPAGNEIPAITDTVYSLIAVTSQTDIIWEQVFINGQCFKIQNAVPLAVDSFQIENADTKEVVLLHKMPGEELWNLPLEKVIRTAVSEDGLPSNRAELKVEGKKIRTEIKEIIRVEGIPAV